VNILTGETARTRLQADAQNYIVCPKQYWIDGVVTAEGSVRQFVAVPLGAGRSVGEQMGRGEAPALSLTAFVPRAQGNSPPTRLASSVSFIAKGDRVEYPYELVYCGRVLKRCDVKFVKHRSRQWNTPSFSRESPFGAYRRHLPKSISIETAARRRAL
jgi:hypothetical protein